LFLLLSAAGKSRGAREGAGKGGGTKDAAQGSCLSKHAEAGRACSGAGHCVGRGQEHSLAPITFKPEGSGASLPLRAHPSHSTALGQLQFPSSAPALPSTRGGVQAGPGRAWSDQQCSPRSRSVSAVCATQPLSRSPWSRSGSGSSGSSCRCWR
jgi:hypothetical protein